MKRPVLCGYVHLCERPEVEGYVCSVCGKWFDADHVKRARLEVGEKEFVKLERERKKNEALA